MRNFKQAYNPDCYEFTILVDKPGNPSTYKLLWIGEVDGIWEALKIVDDRLLEIDRSRNKKVGEDAYYSVITSVVELSYNFVFLAKD